MFSMIAVALYAVWKKKITSRFHTVLLICAVFCNILIWLVEQFLPRGFEWLSVSYILTECLLLVIYHSMQRQGLMKREEKTYSYTINVLLSVFALLFANFYAFIQLSFLWFALYFAAAAYFNSRILMKVFDPLKEQASN